MTRFTDSVESKRWCLGSDATVNEFGDEPTDHDGRVICRECGRGIKGYKLATWTEFRKRAHLKLVVVK